MTEATMRAAPTDDPRTWDAFVAVGTVVLLGIACFAPEPSAIALGIAGVLTVGAAYLLLGRRALLLDRPSVPFQAALVVGAAVAAHAFGPLGAAQALAAPLVWAGAGSSVRRAVVANVALFGAVAIAYAVHGDSIALLVTTQALSFAFSMVIGLWISGLDRAKAERDRLIARLELAQASIARLSGDQAAASERARIARDLHDTIAQDLAAIAMLAQRSEPEPGLLRSIEELAQGALAEVRGLVAASSGIGLGEGLAVALERLGARFAAETGVAVEVDAEPLELTVDAEVALLRTAQEALANVRKHAAATGVRIGLRADGAGTVLVVADDGQGFDRGAVARGLGLQGLGERMALAGGSFEVASSPAGTTVTARLAADAADGGAA